LKAAGFKVCPHTALIVLEKRLINMGIDLGDRILQILPRWGRGRVIWDQKINKRFANGRKGSNGLAYFGDGPAGGLAQPKDFICNVSDC